MFKMQTEAASITPELISVKRTQNTYQLYLVDLNCLSFLIIPCFRPF